MAKPDQWTEELAADTLQEFQLDDYVNTLAAKASSRRLKAEQEEQGQHLWQGSAGLEKFMSTLKNFRRRRNRHSFATAPENIASETLSLLTPCDKPIPLLKQAKPTLRTITQPISIKPTQPRKISHVQLNFPEQRRNSSNRSAPQEMSLTATQTFTRLSTQSMFQRIPSNLIKNIYQVGSQLLVYDEKCRQAKVRANMYRIIRGKQETICLETPNLSSKKMLTEQSQSPQSRKNLRDLSFDQLAPNRITKSREFLPYKKRMAKTSNSQHR